MGCDMKFQHLLDQSTYTLIEVEQRLKEAYQLGLKERVSENKELYGHWQNTLNQLADSQQEFDRLKEELEASDWVCEQACKAIESAIKKTARECIEAIEKQHGGLGLAFTLRQRYGLEG